MVEKTVVKSPPLLLVAAGLIQREKGQFLADGIVSFVVRSVGPARRRGEAAPPNRKEPERLSKPIRYFIKQ